MNKSTTNGTHAMTRRTLLGGSVALGLGAAAATLAGCSQTNNASSNETGAADASSDNGGALPHDNSYLDSTDLEDRVDKVWDITFNDAYPHGNKGMGCVALAVKDGKVIFEKAYGHAYEYDADYNADGSTYANPVYKQIDEPRAMTTGTLFDLASCTKVMATTQSIMMLVDQGKISVDDLVADYLPGFERNDKGSITLAQLLTQSSGLPQWEPTYLYCNSREEQLEYIKNLSLDTTFKTDGSEPKYSDFSFMTLGFVVEAVTGQPMEEFVKENVYRPLQMNSTGYLPLQNGFSKDQIAATSLGNPYEYRMIDEANWPEVGYDCTKYADAFAAFDGWRRYTLIGEVNDGNAGMGGQGVAGHAGLFSTADDLAILLQLMCNGGEYGGVRLYSEDTVKLFTTKHTSYAEAHDGKLSYEFGYGFKLDQSWMGESATEACYGHDGFTGNTLFVDPDNKYIFICLSNRMQAGFRDSDSSAYYNTNANLSLNMNEAVRGVLGI